MPSQQQRRARLQLAQRRTAPTRVRARVSDDGRGAGADGESRPRRRIPWVTIGTAVGAVAAIGSVIFTGIATYYGSEVAEQQLEQSQEDSAKEEREHAQTFSYWVESTRTGLQLRVQNRSPDAIPQATLHLYGMGQVRNHPLGLEVYKRAAVWMTTTRPGPCTELTYSLTPVAHSTWVYGITPGGKESRDVVREVYGSGVHRALFTDRDGKRWVKTAKSLKPWNSKGKFKYPKRARVVGQIPDDPKVKRAAACDSNTNRAAGPKP